MALLRVKGSINRHKEAPSHARGWTRNQVWGLRGGVSGVPPIHRYARPRRPKGAVGGMKGRSYGRAQALGAVEMGGISEWFSLESRRSAAGFAMPLVASSSERPAASSRHQNSSTLTKGQLTEAVGTLLQ